MAEPWHGHVLDVGDLDVGVQDVGALYNAPTHVTRIWCLAYILYPVSCILYDIPVEPGGTRWKWVNVLVGLWQASGALSPYTYIHTDMYVCMYLCRRPHTPRDYPVTIT